MSKVTLVIIAAAVLSWPAGAAFGYTMPGYAPYDGLISIDPGGLPIAPGTLHVNAGAGYWMADKRFDDKGFSEYDDAKPNALLVASDVGYAFNEHYMADVTLQLLRPSYTWRYVTETGAEMEEKVDNVGLGDIWVKARGLWEAADYFYLGPRLAVKAPVGKVDYASPFPQKEALGDDQADVDIALVAGLYSEVTTFMMSAQAGFRYRTKKTVSEYVQISPAPMDYAWRDYDVTPGMMFYVHAEPGVAVSREQKFQTYVPVGYAMSTKDENTYPGDWPATAPKKEGVGHSSLYIGLYPKYQLDERNAIGLKFLYPLEGKNTPQGTYFALTYGAFIKL